ncbi:hypothetical protein L195_g029778, partial [Trifolium pratense]
AILFLFLTRLLLLNEIRFLHADLPPPPIIAAKSPSTTKQSSLSLFSSQFQAALSWCGCGSLFRLVLGSASGFAFCLVLAEVCLVRLGVLAFVCAKS